MVIILILFFASLLAIIVMLGRQIILLRRGEVRTNEGGVHPFVPEVLKVKYLAETEGKRYGFLLLVALLRTYFRVASSLKTSYQNTRVKIKTAIEKKMGKSGEGETTREVSGFLRMVGEYKHRLRSLKHKIKEEENK